LLAVEQGSSPRTRSSPRRGAHNRARLIRLVGGVANRMPQLVRAVVAVGKLGAIEPTNTPFAGRQTEHDHTKTNCPAARSTAILMNPETSSSENPRHGQPDRARLSFGLLSPVRRVPYSNSHNPKAIATRTAQHRIESAPITMADIPGASRAASVATSLCSRLRSRVGKSVLICASGSHLVYILPVVNSLCFIAAYCLKGIPKVS